MGVRAQGFSGLTEPWAGRGESCVGLWQARPVPKPPVDRAGVETLKGKATSCPLSAQCPAHCKPPPGDSCDGEQHPQVTLPCGALSAQHPGPSHAASLCFSRGLFSSLVSPGGRPRHLLGPGSRMGEGLMQEPHLLTASSVPTLSPC